MALTTGSARTSASRGFSLLEVLIGSVLLLFVILGILPLMTRAMLSVNEGREASIGSAYARSAVDETEALPLDHSSFEIPAGSDERIDTVVWDPRANEWIPPGDAAVEAISPWARSVRVRVFSFHDYDDATGQFVAPLDGDADLRFKTFWEVGASLDNRRATGALGAARGVDVVEIRRF